MSRHEGSGDTVVSGDEDPEILSGVLMGPGEDIDRLAVFRERQGFYRQLVNGQWRHAWKTRGEKQ